MKNYDGLFMSTYTVQLPPGKDIIRVAYDEGYDWIYQGIWEKGFSSNPRDFLKVWLGDDRTMLPMNKMELEEYIKGRDWADDPFPSEETMCLCKALHNGNPHPYDNDLLSTGNLALDIDGALWDGLYEGYRDAVHEAADKCGSILKENDN